jgi:hypothetical protein
VSVLLSDWVIPDHTFNSREGGHRVHVLRSADWQVEPQLGHAEVDPSVLDVDAPKAVPLDYASSWLSISSSLHGSAGDSANDIFDREFSFPATAEMPSIVTAPERASYQPQTTMTSRSKSSHAFSNYSSSASSSSWVIQTPATNTDRSSSALSTDRIKDEAATAVAPEESEKNARGAPNHGPCSRVWNLPAVSAVHKVAQDVILAY